METEDDDDVESLTPKKKAADDEYSCLSELSATMQAVVEEEKKMQAKARAFGEQVLYEVEQKEKAPPAARQAKVLTGEYQGAAYRSKSIKSAKRTAAAQDSEDEDL